MFSGPLHTPGIDDESTGGGGYAMNRESGFLTGCYAFNR